MQIIEEKSQQRNFPKKIEAQSPNNTINCQKNFEKIKYTFLLNVNTTQKIFKSRSHIKVFNGKDAIFQLRKQNLTEDESSIFLTKLLKEESIAAYKDGGDIFIVKKFNENFEYIIVKEPINYNIVMCGIIILLAVLSLTMFQLWPAMIRNKIHYFYYLIFAFIIFLIVLGIIRLVVFGITFFFDHPGWWLFPNLFADVGFFESFKPLWERGKEQSDIDN